MIISCPVITEFNAKDLKFILIGCDGMYELWENNKIINWFDKNLKD